MSATIGNMPAYALAHLRDIRVHADIVEYLDRIEATLTPYGGRFLVHGPKVEVREGSWPGTVVIIEFPTAERARDWYESPAYQDILPLRTRHIDGDAVLLEGVGPDYHPSSLAEAMRARVDNTRTG
jgi:uncharacterized protein (DUF1330 family)